MNHDHFVKPDGEVVCLTVKDRPCRLIEDEAEAQCIVANLRNSLDIAGEALNVSTNQIGTLTAQVDQLRRENRELKDEIWRLKWSLAIAIAATKYKPEPQP